VSFEVAWKLQKAVFKRFPHVLYQTDGSKKVFSLLIPGFLANQVLQGLAEKIFNLTYNSSIQLYGIFNSKIQLVLQLVSIRAVKQLMV
jgi:hypothetical protein